LVSPSRVLPAGTTAEDTVRRAGILIILGELDRAYNARTRWPKLLRPFGIDPAKFLPPTEKASPAKGFDEQTAACEVCGCTWDDACPGGCSWDPGFQKQGRAVCSQCTAKASKAKPKKLAGDVRRAKAKKKGKG
jgi:hypothetical protein